MSGRRRRRWRWGCGPGHGHGHGHGSEGDLLEPQIRGFTEPCILLSLSGGQAHGYQLMRTLQDLGVSAASVDTGNIYRTLRLMEDEGLVASDWATVGGGPARREYRITDLGREALQVWSEALRRTRADLDRFLEAHARQRESGEETRGQAH